MSSGIKEYDVGYVAANSTWHDMPQYKCLGEGVAVTLEQAREVLDYGIKKQPLYRCLSLAPVPDAYCITRTDKDIVIVPHVGDRFTVENNVKLLEQIERFVLPEFPDLQLDSVGTLYNGATAFLSLRIAEFQITGDESNNVAAIMFYNPIGFGCMRSCAHTTRIVCNNTARISMKQGEANGSLAKFRHTSGMAKRVADHMVTICQAQLGLKRMTETLEFLTTQQVNTEYVDTYLEKFFPSRRDPVLAILEEEGSMARGTKYHLYQSMTNYLDHTFSKKSDQAFATFDGITGNRAAKKDAVLDYLTTV